MTASTGEQRTEVREERPRGVIPYDSFGARVMLARVHAGYQTIEDAATKCSLNRQSWANWERGMRPRDLLDVVNAISEGLGIDREWLLWGGELAPEPRRRSRESLAERRRGLRHKDGSRPGSGVTGYKHGVTISAGRPPRGHRAPLGPADNRTPGLPAQTRDRGRPVRLSGPLDL